jgi:tRNA 2-thiouridine synthesizing protein A
LRTFYHVFWPFGFLGGMMMMHKLDTCGEKCPLPIMRTKQVTSKLVPGEQLLVVATDPSFAVDCAVFVKQHGHKLVNSWQEGERHYFILEAS